MNFDKNIAKQQQQAGRVRAFAATSLAVLLMGTMALAGGVGQGMWGRGGSSVSSSQIQALAQAASGWSSNGTTTTTTMRMSSTVASGSTAYAASAGSYSCFDTAETACWRVTGGNGSGTLAFYGTTVSAANWAVGPTNSIGPVAFSATVPTITSACTSPTITHGTSTSFQMDVGSSCTGVSTIVLGLPAATNGWECHGYNKTTSTVRLEPTADTSTSFTFVNTAKATGAATDLVAGADLVISCTGR